MKSAPNQFIIEGFVKRAQELGIPEERARQLAKEAGVGDFLHSTFVQPVQNTFRDGARSLGYFGKGQFGRGFKALGSTLGNAALTGLTFLPGAGMAGIAAKGLLGGGAKALGGLAARSLGKPGAGVVQNAMGQVVPKMTRTGVAPGGVGTQMLRPTGGAGSTLASWSQKLQGAQRGFQNFQQKGTDLAMRGMDMLGRGAQQGWQGVRGALSTKYQPGAINQAMFSGPLNRLQAAATPAQFTRTGNAAQPLRPNFARTGAPATPGSQILKPQNTFRNRMAQGALVGTPIAATSMFGGSPAEGPLDMNGQRIKGINEYLYQDMQEQNPMNQWANNVPYDL